MNPLQIDVPKGPIAANPWVGYEQLNYAIKVVTPILGGGALANKCEECFAVRPSEIRGHLRFWWRKLFAKNLDGDALRSAETAVWGDSKNASNVCIVVEGAPFKLNPMPNTNTINGPRGPVRHCFGYKSSFRDDNKDLGPLYAMFSVTNEKKDVYITNTDQDFFLNVFVKPEYLEQVKMSIAAWGYLGGIGSRTRRGLGSLSFVSGNAITLDEVLKQCGIFAMFGQKMSSPVESWKEALCLYKNFRQCRRVLKEDGRTMPKRSFWTEAESCRKATKQRLPKHEPLGNDLDGKGAVGDDFCSPRAALGMPILIQFKDQNSNKNDVSPEMDPVTVTISVEGDEARMGSPVIIKPLLREGSWCPSFIFLCDSAKDALGDKLDKVVSSTAKKRNLKPVVVLRGNAVPAEKLDVAETTDAIIALQQYVEKRGFKKIGGDK